MRIITSGITKVVVILGLIFLVLEVPNVRSQFSDFWAARVAKIAPNRSAPKIKVGIWDSGVDIDLFRGRLATDSRGKILLRGYDSFKIRKDTAMAVLPPEILARRDELNSHLKAFDDLGGGVDSAEARALDTRLKKMSKKDEDEFYELVDLWSGYSHGTAVADIALSRNPNALAIVARMEWWHGSPPVPCWTRELADREAKSIGDLLQYLVKNGARVVNMSWGRFESSYTGALKKCSPAMPESERKQLARYTVEKIRKVLQEGMKASPNVLYVGAAGNSGTSIEAANPATRFSLPNFLIVGAVDRNGAKAKFTNTGSEVTLYANGERVPARMPGGEMSFPSGTSMAVPNAHQPCS